MLHGRRLTPLPQQWMAQMNNAAPSWNAMRQRQAEKDAAIKERRLRDWEGIEAGTVVILGADMTTESYGVALCDEDGETILMDGTVKLIDGDVAWVDIQRVSGKAKPGRGGFETSEMRWVRRKDIYKVSNKPANVWGNGEQAIVTAMQRDGRRRGDRSRFWSPG